MTWLIRLRRSEKWNNTHNVVRYLVYDLSELKIGQSVNFTSQRRPILIESMKCAVTKFKNKICKITLLSNNGGSRGVSRVSRHPPFCLGALFEKNIF